MVPPGFRFAVEDDTNRPEDAERDTDRLLPVPDPTRSVVVLPGQRATVDLLTNRPVFADLLTDLAMLSTSQVPMTWLGVSLHATDCSVRVMRACPALARPHQV